MAADAARPETAKMTPNQGADLVMKVGGVLATVGFFAGGLLNAHTTCTPSTLGGGPRTCSNWLGAVEMNMLGTPSSATLFIWGGLCGAILGALIGFGIVLLKPNMKGDLFP